MPALRKFIVMPPPMVPAPITATLSTLRTGVSAGTSGILEAARSPKNAWRIAFDSSDWMSSMKISRSRRMPSSKGIVTAASTASTHFSGAASPFEAAATALRAASKCARASGSSIFTSRISFAGLPATCRAKRTAPSTMSPSTISWMSAVPLSLPAGTGVPVVIMFNAASTPTARGRRCVPPAPGISPSFTSGSASGASAFAMR